MEAFPAPMRTAGTGISEEADCGAAGPTVALYGQAWSHCCCMRWCTGPPDEPPPTHPFMPTTDNAPSVAIDKPATNHSLNLKNPRLGRVTG